ncbi:anamorsin homolog isoform X2 [Sitodiplosis mosellana]|uniref:anamorsin homolog isoform X2 n=1 Tax=Sitodiplosis mosellana TaxID=263140 RepID=UPI002443A5AB|nr:anamorsin homolog isoform X2 [Sitodiplosis mosellana]
MDLIQPNEIILLIWDASFDLEKSGFDADSLKVKFDAAIKFENILRLNLAAYSDSTFTLIILKTNGDNLDIPLFASILKLLKPSGRLAVSSQNSDQVRETLKLAGFVNISANGKDIVGEKPKYEIGSAAKLSFAKKEPTNNKVATVWKLTDEDDDVINENDLLDENDKIKPDPSNLRVCGTTGKRKACKDCSCGLADELAAESKQNMQSTETAKSSCGSCYLGDAFRCATCPYLGMPAFKPGEKVQLSGGLSKDDL